MITSQALSNPAVLSAPVSDEGNEAPHVAVLGNGVCGHILERRVVVGDLTIRAAVAVSMPSGINSKLLLTIGDITNSSY